MGSPTTESHGPPMCQPTMKNASGNALQTAPHLWWDLNFHFVFNKSVTLRWQVSWAIFRGATVFKIRGRAGLSLFLSRNMNHVLILWLSGQGFGLAIRTFAAFWAQCIGALGELECLRGVFRKAGSSSDAKEYNQHQASNWFSYGKL